MSTLDTLPLSTQSAKIIDAARAALVLATDERDAGYGDLLTAIVSGDIEPGNVGPRLADAGRDLDELERDVRAVTAVSPIIDAAAALPKLMAEREAAVAHREATRKEIIEAERVLLERKIAAERAVDAANGRIDGIRSGLEQIEAKLSLPAVEAFQPLCNRFRRAAADARPDVAQTALDGMRVVVLRDMVAAAVSRHKDATPPVAVAPPPPAETKPRPPEMSTPSARLAHQRAEARRTHEESMGRGRT